MHTPCACQRRHEAHLHRVEIAHADAARQPSREHILHALPQRRRYRRTIRQTRVVEEDEVRRGHLQLREISLHRMYGACAVVSIARTSCSAV